MLYDIADIADDVGTTALVSAFDNAVLHQGNTKNIYNFLWQKQANWKLYCKQYQGQQKSAIYSDILSQIQSASGEIIQMELPSDREGAKERQKQRKAEIRLLGPVAYRSDFVIYMYNYL